MQLDQLLAFLLGNSYRIVSFFNDLWNRAYDQITNFWLHLQRSESNAVQRADVSTNSVVSGAKSFLQSVISFGDNVLHGRITNVFNDLSNIFNTGRTLLTALVSVTKSELLSNIASAFGVVSNAFTNADKLLRAALGDVDAFLDKKIDSVDLEFKKIITMTGLTLAEKRALLKLFVDDPLGFIASVFFEIAIPILLYEIARGIARANLEIGNAPYFNEKIALNGGRNYTIQSPKVMITLPIHNTKLSGYRYNPPHHNGVDFDGDLMHRVYAAHDGVVTRIKNDDFTYGKCLEIKNDLFSSFYGHLNDIDIRVDEYVKQGDLIGYVGKTGQATGYHLHFELRVKGGLVNPLEYIEVK